jgi:thiamine-monophosphate kinase
MASTASPRSRSSASAGGGELAVIERIRSRATANSGNPKHLRLGIGDDCAILRPPPGHDLLVTTDFSLEGRHFRRDWHPAASVGHRTLTRGLSDLAAMGATPLAAFLSLALPKNLARNTTWLDGFFDGLLALAHEHRVPLAGGDTAESPGYTRKRDARSPDIRVRSGHILADIVLLGAAPAGRALRRSGARPGDILYCTGSLGGAAAELAALAVSPRKFRTANADGDHPHLFPRARLAVGDALLRRRLATACIDISDGLSTDLSHLCQASSVSAELHAASLPLHPLAQQLGPAAALHAALHGGEDYELLFTAPAATKLPRSLAGVRITAIGRILRQRKGQPQLTVIDRDGRRSALEARGWEHLR